MAGSAALECVLIVQQLGWALIACELSGPTWEWTKENLSKKFCHKDGHRTSKKQIQWQLADWRVHVHVSSSWRCFRANFIAFTLTLANGFPWTEQEHKLDGKHKHKLNPYECKIFGWPRRFIPIETRHNHWASFRTPLITQAVLNRIRLTKSKQ